MLQASKALNLSLYLLLKSDQASKSNPNNDILMDDDDADDIHSHPVMDRLNQLSQLTDKLQENVEDKTSGLKQQLHSLVKAAALMNGEDDSDASSDEEDEGGVSAEDKEKDDASDATPASEEQQPLAQEGASDSDEETESQGAIQRRIMTEARFALRNQDLDHDQKKSKSNQRQRRLAPSSSDFGDDTEEVTEKALAAGRKLASTMNSIAQKSSGTKKKLAGDEDEDADEYERLQRGLSMMDEEFGWGGSDDDAKDGAGSMGEGDSEGFGDEDDGEDFYQKIKSKSKAKKDARKQMYAVAPKYPRIEGDVEGTCFGAMFALLLVCRTRLSNFVIFHYFLFLR